MASEGERQQLTLHAG